MQEKNQFILNIITIISFILYALVIYLHVAVLGNPWGNIAVDLALEIVGPLVGVIIVATIGTLILLFTFKIQVSKNLNLFLCWFWIFSLYQCVINAFLQFYGLPDEPINQFFKSFFPSLWYPTKELVFGIIALALTYLWVKRTPTRHFKKADILLISLAFLILVGGTLISQVFLMS
ncbi:MAG: hypothetical protein ACTSRS_02680 [Candidatus Helarchaeota archaeon]